MGVSFNTTKLAAGMRPCRMLAATSQTLNLIYKKTNNTDSEGIEKAQRAPRDETGSGLEGTDMNM